MTKNTHREGTGRTALITGASAGIGRALAEVFAEHGFSTVLVARRQERLVALSEDLERAHGVTTRVIAADLSDPASPPRIRQILDDAGVVVDALVNNAGYAIKPDFCSQDWERHAAFLQVLATSVAHLCHLFCPGMKARGYGRILNVASLAAFSPDTAGSLYTGVKSFVVHLSRALDLELRPHGVHCTALCPGFTRTEFHEAMGVQKEVNRLPGLLWTDAQEVARQGFGAVMKGKPVVITGLVNQAIASVCKVVPDALQHELSRLQGRPF